MVVDLCTRRPVSRQRFTAFIAILATSATILACGQGHRAGTTAEPTASAQEEDRDAEADTGVAPVAAGPRTVGIPCTVSPIDPHITWTGSAFAVTWHGEDWDHEDSGQGDAAPAQDADVITTEAWLALVSEAGEVTGPVLLEHAGVGPPMPLERGFSRPVWDDGSLVLGWFSVFLGSDGQRLPSRRDMVGRWRPDGTALHPPRKLLERPIGVDYEQSGQIALTSCADGLFLSVPAIERQSGCSDEHGVSDSVKVIRLGADATSTALRYECGDVMMSFDSHRFGAGMLTVIHNAHVGYHTYVRCHPPTMGCDGDYWEASSPFRGALVTSEGAAVLFERLDTDDVELEGDLVTVIRPEGSESRGVVDARLKTLRLEWTERGLRIVVETWTGPPHYLAYASGDMVTSDLVSRVLEQDAPPASEMVWNGRTIGETWVEGEHVMVRIVERRHTSL